MYNKENFWVILHESRGIAREKDEWSPFLSVGNEYMRDTLLNYPEIRWRRCNVCEEMAKCETEIRMEKIMNCINKRLVYNLRNYTA